MTVTQGIAWLGYMVVCSFTPGPGNILALSTTGKYGFQKSKHLLLGICAGYAAVQALCTVFLCALNYAFSDVLGYLRYADALYMLWLAIHIMRSGPPGKAEDKSPTFAEGFLLQLVNVKIYFYIISLLSGCFIPNFSTIFGLILAGMFAVSIGSIASLLWAFLGIKIQKYYQRYYRYIHIILGLFLVYCAWSMVRG